MLDISDGLAADLHHILEASGVGAVLDAAVIPIHADAHAASAHGSGRTPLEHALSDGEDFELLFTLDPAAGERLTANWTDPTPITRIGTITSDRDCVLRTPDGRSHPLPPRGWTHDWVV
jgi:thiamine-monophosphate kinase